MTPGNRPTVIYVASTSVYLAVFWRPLLRHMAKAGWRVITASPTDSFTPRLAEAGVEPLSLPISRKIGAFASHAATRRRLADLYQRERPLIVHHFTTNAVIFGSLAARRARVPHVVNSLPGLGSLFISHRWDAPLLRAWVRTGYRYVFDADNVRVVFQNSADRDQLVGSRIVSSDRSVLIACSGVDLDRFTPSPEPDGEPVLIFCGRMLWSKGVGDLVNAAHRLRERGTRFQLLLVGPAESDHRDAVPLEQLERWHREGIASWLGFRDDMPSLYAASHITVLPTRYPEGLPAVLIEAAASGRPIVCSDMPGCLEIVRHGQNGLVVGRGDVPALADALARLIADRALRERMGRAGREIALAGHGPEALISRMTALYADMRGARKESAAA